MILKGDIVRYRVQEFMQNIDQEVFMTGCCCTVKCWQLTWYYRYTHGSKVFPH